jgi:sulfide:quinone oxidoreductase
VSMSLVQGSRRRVVILGGGTGGTLAANRLRRMYRADEASITVVDQDDRHVYQPGLLFVRFGRARAENLVRSRRRQLRRGVDFVEAAIDHVDLNANVVHLADRPSLGYDVLVVATGAELAAEETEGLAGDGWNENVFTF